MLGQQNTENILREALQKLDCAVEFGTELISVMQDANRVTATLQKTDGSTEHTTYEYLIGADGARSVVRNSLVSLSQERLQKIRWQLEISSWRVWTTRYLFSELLPKSI